MFDIFLELSLLLPVIGVFVIIEILTVPSMVKRRIPFCSNCKMGKFRYKKVDEEEVFLCKKCHTPMEWMEYPEDMFERRVKYFQIVIALFLPIISSLFFLVLVTAFWPVFLIVGIGVTPIAIGIILNRRSKKEILKWAEKQGNL